MNKILFVFTCLIGLQANGQHTMPIQMDTVVYNYEIIATGILNYGSTSVRNEMSKKLIYGGFIDSDMKQRSLLQQNSNNKIGLEATGEIEFRDFKTTLFGQDKFGYYVRAGYNNYLSAAYSKDVFSLIFNGNKSYMGDTAKFSGTQANFISYQKLGFGFIHKKSKSNIGLNYYNIANYYDAFIRDGSLIVDSTASNLALDMGGRFQYSQGKKFNKGWGIGVDADFRIPVKWINDAQAYFQIQLKNIGFMSVHTTEYLADSLYNFSGFKFNQFLGDSALSFDNGQEFLDTLGIRRLNKKVNSFLAGYVQIGKVVDDRSQKIVQSYFGVRLFTNLNYTPLVFVGAHFKLYDWMKVGIQGSYGGFSNFRLGFYGQYDVGKFHIGIGSDDLIGALTNKGYGESINLRLTRLW